MKKIPSILKVFYNPFSAISAIIGYLFASISTIINGFSIIEIIIYCIASFFAIMSVWRYYWDKK